MGLDDALEVHPLMGAIAEGLRLGVAAAAKPDLGASGKAEYFAVLVHDFEVSLDSYGTIVANGNPGGGHSILQ